MLFQLRDIQTIRQGYSLAPVESDLRRLCAAHLENNKKDISGDIKLYLEQKEKMGIIKRPQLLSVEIDILRTFGLTVPEKTYYNA